MLKETYPSIVVNNRYGASLAAAEDLEQGTVVEILQGNLVQFHEIPPEDICYAYLLDTNNWLVPTNNTRYLNHSCSPNCRITDLLEVVTTQPVKAGEDLTISYNNVTFEELVRNPDAYIWDDRWTFECKCNAESCMGSIDRYVVLG